jgi:hypothetical protein
MSGRLAGDDRVEQDQQHAPGDGQGTLNAPAPVQHRTVQPGGNAHRRDREYRQ